MILGKITGKVTTKKFFFTASATIHNLDYIKIYHPAYDYVLAQIVEIEATTQGRTATCITHGYLHNGKLKPIRIPFEPGSEVLRADDEFIQETLQLPEHAANIGKIDGHDIPVSLDIKKLLTKHVSILAKSGAGKSYTVGVLLEEILEHNIPVVIIDPHAEHSTLKEPANPTTKKEKERLARYGVTPKGYSIIEYNQEENPLLLSSTMSRQELETLLPKLNTTQQGLLFQALRNQEDTDFDQLLLNLEAEESMTKWSLINLIESLKNYKLFSNQPTNPHDLVKQGRATIINLKGYPPDIQEIIAYKLAKDLFELRKQNQIAPFFLVLEEAHNFCPERSFGEAASSKILRTIASEGRKFGLGLCVISQRPARVDKSVLSQCTTQIIMKITNPHDLKAVSNSVEGLTSETEQEIRNLPVGTAIVTGIIDLPLITNIRPRRTKHGGEAVDITKPFTKPEPTKEELLPVIMPTITPKDLRLMHEEPVTITTTLTPALRITGENKNKETITLLIDKTKNELITNHEGSTKKLPTNLLAQEKQVLVQLRKHKKINPEELGIQEQTIQSLQAKGYIKKNKQEYTLTNIYHLGRLTQAQLHTALTYEHIQGTKQQARYSNEQAKNLVKKLFTIKNEQECWYVQHHAQKKIVL